MERGNSSCKNVKRFVFEEYLADNNHNFIITTHVYLETSSSRKKSFVLF